MPLYLLPEHKIGFFVRFWPSEAPFLGFSSTKSRFLCAFGVWNPRFRAFRAQNRGFCALFAFGTPIFGTFEHKIEVFVSEWAIFPRFWVVLTQNRGFCAREGPTAAEDPATEDPAAEDSATEEGPDAAG